MIPGYDPEAPTPEQVAIGMAAHGMSVVTVERDPASGRLTPVMDAANRRITATTPMTLTGPAAGDALVRTQRRPRGPHGARHAQQLRRRGHAVAHGAHRRGEHRPVLRERRGRRGPGARPLRHGRRRHRPQVGARRPPLRPRPASPPSRTASAGSSRSTRSTRRRRRASTPRSAASSTRAPTCGSGRPAPSRCTWVTTSGSSTSTSSSRPAPTGRATPPPTGSRTPACSTRARSSSRGSAPTRRRRAPTAAASGCRWWSRSPTAPGARSSRA